MLSHDPNYMRGPDGYVTPGQLMRYEVEFENEGNGTAFDVYITDVFDANLDASAIAVKDFKLVDWATGAETPTVFPYTYDPQTRKLTVLAGEFGPKKGGKFAVELILNPSVAPGTVVQNYATVYFPTALEATPTNAIVSVVPRAAQITYTGSPVAQYSDYALLQATVTYNGQLLLGKTVNFYIGDSSYTAVTEAFGWAQTYPKLYLPPGEYTVTAAFPGDGYYYTASTVTASLQVLKDNVSLPDFSTVTYSTTPALNIAVTDDEGEPLLHSDGAMYLEYLDSDTWKSLGETVISSGTASFSFSLPEPRALQYPLRARFGGNAYYYAAQSTATLAFVDITTPTVNILSPLGEQAYKDGQQIAIDFIVADDFDVSPASSAFLTHLADGATMQAVNGAHITASTLAGGLWTLTVSAQDMSGNSVSTTTLPFEILADAMPPRTALSATNTISGSGHVYITAASSATLASADDLLVLGDNIGLGVSTVSWRIGNGAWLSAVDTAPAPGKIFTVPVSLTGLADGVYPVYYYAEDSAGNKESVAISTYAVDTTPPQVIIASPTAGAVYTPANRYIPVSFSYADNLSTAASVSARLLEIENTGLASGATEYAVTPDTLIDSALLDDGLWLLEILAIDDVGNSTTAVSGVFEIVHDTAPPRATLAGGLLQGSVRYARGDTPFTLLAIDDLLVVNDNIGVGVASQYATLKTSTGAIAQSFAFTNAAPAVGGVFTSTFAFTGQPDGDYILEYYAKDAAGNTSTVSTAAVTLDNTAPQTALTFPSPIAQGLERAMTGAVDISGSVCDLRISSWTLSANGILIASGSACASGVLAVWNTAGLSGAVSLRLESADILNNRSVVESAVYIGRPHISDAMGRWSPKVVNVNRPHGVVVGADGLVWVSDTGNDRVIALDSDGSVVKEIGNDRPWQWKHWNCQKGLKLNKPHGIALDAQNNIILADTLNNRVLKLSDEGAMLLEIKSGLKQPAGVAVDAANNIYVTDQRNGMVKIFNASGRLIRSFATGVDESQPDYAAPNDKDERDAFGWDDFNKFMKTYSRPYGIALDSAGYIWVSDERRDRIAVFTPEGVFARDIGAKGKTAGKLRNPAGLTLDAQSSVYVADRQNNRVQKFSSDGDVLLAFGHESNNWRNNLFMPTDVSFTADKNLWVADTFHSRLLLYSVDGTALSLANVKHNGYAPAGFLAAAPAQTTQEGAAVYETATGYALGKLITASGGGLYHDKGAAVSIPAGAITQDTEFTIAEGTTAPSSNLQAQNGAMSYEGAVFDIGPSVIAFGQPVTVTLAAESGRYALPALYWQNPDTGNWEEQKSAVSDGKVTALVKRLGAFRLANSAQSADASFRLGEIYSYPNPAKRQNPTLHIETGIADSVELRIYDISGRQLHDQTITGAPQTINGKYAYEYTWDVGGVGSGVYIYVVRTNKAGYSSLTKKGRLAVVK